MTCAISNPSRRHHAAYMPLNHWQCHRHQFRAKRRWQQNNKHTHTLSLMKAEAGQQPQWPCCTMGFAKSLDLSPRSVLSQGRGPTCHQFRGTEADGTPQPSNLQEMAGKLRCNCWLPNSPSAPPAALVPKQPSAVQGYHVCHPLIRKSVPISMNRLRVSNL